MYLRSVLLSLCYALPLARADFIILTDRPELVTATMADSRVRPAILGPSTVIVDMKTDERL